MAPATQVKTGRVDIYHPSGNYKNLVDQNRWNVDSSHTGKIGYLSIVKLEADGNAELAAGTDVPWAIVVGMWDENHVPLSTTGYINASTQGQIEVIKFATGIGLNISEDADGGVINFPTTPYADLTAQTVGGDAQDSIIQGPQMIRYIDSSTASASAGSLRWKILRKDGSIINNRRAGDTTSALRYIIIPTSYTA